ncbi:APC transporter [Acetobacter aceti NRIC 0242]|uniref:Nitrate reductase n=1 Tax=Acetobacter aceti NBRC 14818 TaxID=887700 RepID=A0AB33II23_ACEAC|nr:NCS1 family nucleobase:cation symporter-1 [Acetobacter aceti]TCS34170.1 NCS1 family nucleobase:cation symporter-1 [Acetobacter aceti NBRC 14818]BCK75544.1 nitrate reductase [Acetobacter aceti NBRC 14818]GAN56693.1 amino acid/polyamine/organocation transporter/nucleobase cation symporters-1 (NCS1) [Acetobacter aceti NBRC 14818]GBO79793.1 APC transporter [Acetobacter aceti NRIC 0242]
MSGPSSPQTSSSSLINDDLAPVTQRTWGGKDYLFLWMSNIHSVAGYVTVSSLFVMGLPLQDVFLALLLGILVVQVACNLVAAPSFRTGAPFPVVVRMTFGVYGAILAALIRGLIAIGWYGIQTWLASNALVVLAVKLWPAIEPWAIASQHGFVGLSLVGWVAFMTVWTLQIMVFWNGMDAIRHFIDWAGPIIYGMMALLDGWLLFKTGGHASFHMFHVAAHPTFTQQFSGIVNAMALIFAYFSPIILNFGDFARYGVSMRAIRSGNFWGLPFNLLAFAFLTLLTIALTLPVFGHLIFDPIETVVKTTSLTTALLGVLTVVTATIGINISANFVSAAFDFSNIAPNRLSWRQGGLIAATGAIIVTPWNLYARPELVHLTLDVLGSCITPMVAILLADYYIVKKQHIQPEVLYSSDRHDAYWYQGGINPVAISALVAGTLCGLSFIFFAVFAEYRNLSCVAGFMTAFGCYLLLAQMFPHQCIQKKAVA